MRSSPEVDYGKVSEIIKRDIVPVMTEMIHREVAHSVEEFSGKKLTRVEAIERYLAVLYEAQRANHNVHDEISEALKQFRQEIGL